MIVIANWKMNGNLNFNKSLISKLIKNLEDLKFTKCVLCLPFTYLHQFEYLKGDSKIILGAQNLSIYNNGPYTGEISAEMLNDFHCKYVIIGHSERRQLLKETDIEIRAKFETAIKNKLIPVICLGETYEDYNSGNSKNKIKTQLRSIIESLKENFTDNFYIAYEPIWAIGTGKVASAEYAQDIHFFIKNELRHSFGHSSEGIKVIYGGSVNSSNALNLFKMSDIDGGLVGGASLKEDEFTKICFVANETY